jgi:hypothetical protein
VEARADGAAAPAAAATPAGLAGVARELKTMRSANEEMLRKQAATLELLEELEKQAGQLRVYTSRG